MEFVKRFMWYVFIGGINYYIHELQKINQTTK